MRRRAGPVALAGGVLALLAGALLAQPAFDFMPDGGRNSLSKVFGSAPEDLAAVAAATHDAAGWEELIAGRAPDLSPKEARTLASWLSVAAPLPAERIAAADGAAALVAAFPPDGKELAIANCQFCHGFFTGYLAHDRDADGWRGVFNAPYHSELPMSAKERETFALYSAINMPIAYQDVPADLRF